MATSTSANVNKPTNVQQKEADINRKLQVYGIISAFQTGKLPSNDQIDVALNSFLGSKALASPSNKLSDEGKVLIEDVRDVVKQAKLLLLSKNQGNLLQDFVWQTQQFDPQAVSTPNAPIDKGTAKQHGDQALEGLRTLGTLIITNGQFRKLLSDATTLFRDMAADAASNAASTVRPSDEKLSQIDHPADDHTWHDAPDFSKENLKSQAQTLYKGDLKADAKDVVSSATSAAHPSGSTQPRDLAGAAAHEQQTSSNTGIDAQGGLAAAKNTLQSKIDKNADTDAVESNKEAARQKKEEYKARTKQYFSRKMPEERREQTVWRLKKMVVECQQHPDYQRAISTLLDLAEEYGRHASRVSKEGTGTVQETRSGLSQAETDLRTLIERFANGTSSEDLWESINAVYRDADNDEELKNWFRSLNAYVRKCLQQEGYVLDDASTHEWNRLYDHGNYLLRDKYRGHTDRIFGEIKFLGDQFDQDPQNKAFAASVTKLFTDLGNDDNGKPTFKPHLVKDLTGVILPAIFESVAYVPIPRIEYSDPQIDAVIENLVLESDNFAPNLFEVFSENYVRWGRKNFSNKNKHALEFKVAGIQMDLRDVSYYVKRKQGFPSITDTGVASILLPGDGFSFKLKVSTADAKDRQHFFKIDKVSVDLHKPQIKLTKSNHKLLFGLFKPIMLRVLRPALQKAAEKAIRDQFTQFDALLYQIKLEADRALEEAREDPENAPNIYNRYASAAQRKILQGKEKVDEKTANTKVNYAVTREDSIFPNIKLPGGISTKATEYKEMARKGDRWETPVFSIGNASKSSDIPTAPQIVRKPHNTSTSNTNGNSYGTTGNTYGSADPAYGVNGGSKVNPFATSQSGAPISSV